VGICRGSQRTSPSCNWPKSGIGAFLLYRGLPDGDAEVRGELFRLRQESYVGDGEEEDLADVLDVVDAEDVLEPRR
jgi:hypothetical protein